MTKTSIELIYGKEESLLDLMYAYFLTDLHDSKPPMPSVLARSSSKPSADTLSPLTTDRTPFGSMERESANSGAAAGSDMIISPRSSCKHDVQASLLTIRLSETLRLSDSNDAPCKEDADLFTTIEASLAPLEEVGELHHARSLASTQLSGTRAGHWRQAPRARARRPAYIRWAAPHREGGHSRR